MKRRIGDLGSAVYQGTGERGRRFWKSLLEVRKKIPLIPQDCQMHVRGYPARGSGTCSAGNRAGWADQFCRNLNPLISRVVFQLDQLMPGQSRRARGKSPSPLHPALAGDKRESAED